MDVKLVMFKADGTRRDFAMSKPRIVLGRTNSADLRIPLSSVSRQHCEVRIDGDQVKVRDMGSSNGTHHNGTRIQEATLAAGDTVMIGPVTFTIVIDGQPSQVRPVHSVVPGEDAPAGGSRGPQKLDVAARDGKMPVVESEHYTPTVDLDDPLAALQRLEEASNENPVGAGAGGGVDEEVPLLADEDADDDEGDDIPLLADDDDDIPLLTDDADDQNAKG